MHDAKIRPLSYTWLTGYFQLFAVNISNAPKLFFLLEVRVLSLRDIELRRQSLTHMDDNKCVVIGQMFS